MNKRYTLIYSVAMLAFIIAGVWIGFYYPDLARTLSPWGRLYISFLKMCILPIIITSIISSIGRIYHQPHFRNYIKRFLAVLGIFLILIAAYGILFAVFTKPAAYLNPQARFEMGKLIAKAESSEDSDFSAEKVIHIYKPDKDTKKGKILVFLLKVIPSNIFKSLNSEEMLKVVFFACFLGIALGFTPRKLSAPIFDISLGLFTAFQKIIHWVMYILPLGLLCLLAGQIVSTGPSVLIGMTSFIGIFYSGVFILVFINSLILWRLSGVSYLKSLSYLKETMLIAFGAKNPFIAMPVAIKSLKEDFHLEQTSVNLLIPLNFTLFGFGFVFTFAFATIFFVQLYDVPINLLSGLILLVACIFATIAAAGAPTVIAYSLLALTFDPFSIPVQPAIIIMLAIQSLLAPGGVLLTVQTNCALTALVTKKERKKIPPSQHPLKVK